MTSTNIYGFKEVDCAILRNVETICYTRVKPGMKHFGKKYEAWRKTTMTKTCKERPLEPGRTSCRDVERNGG